MSEVKRPLEGVKVVELATFIAAPCCARFLADLGAEVIKVEAPAGDPLRYTAVNEGRPQDQKENTSYDLENAGKTCVCLNTKTAAGREALEKLIAGADIFITNWRQPPLKKAVSTMTRCTRNTPSWSTASSPATARRAPTRICRASTSRRSSPAAACWVPCSTRTPCPC